VARCIHCGHRSVERRRGEEGTHVFTLHSHETICSADRLHNAHALLNLVCECRVVVMHVGEEDVRVDGSFREEYLQAGCQSEIRDRVKVDSRRD
jgi:hypothetical protein